MMRASDVRRRVPAGSPAPPDDEPSRDLSHEECLSAYFRQAKLLWGVGMLTRRDRALLDQLRHDLGLSVTEASMLESMAARLLATKEELVPDLRGPTGGPSPSGRTESLPGDP